MLLCPGAVLTFLAPLVLELDRAGILTHLAQQPPRQITFVQPQLRRDLDLTPEAALHPEDAPLVVRKGKQRRPVDRNTHVDLERACPVHALPVRCDVRYVMIVHHIGGSNEGAVRFQDSGRDRVRRPEPLPGEQLPGQQTGDATVLAPAHVEVRHLGQDRVHHLPLRFGHVLHAVSSLEMPVSRRNRREESPPPHRTCRGRGGHLLSPSSSKGGHFWPAPCRAVPFSLWGCPPHIRTSRRSTPASSFGGSPPRTPGRLIESSVCRPGFPPRSGPCPSLRSP